MPISETPEHVGGAVWKRIEWLDHEIRAGRAPDLASLRRRFGVGESCAAQTVAYMRDKLALPIRYDRSRRGYVYTAEPPGRPAPHPGLTLSPAELLALKLAAALASRYLDRNTADDLRALEHRCLAAADPALIREARSWEEHVVFTGPPPLGAPGLRRLLHAVERRRVLTVDYQARFDAVVTRTVEPHFLVNASGDWLLVAWDRTRRAPRTFAVSRIEYFEETGDEFDRRPTLTPKDFTRYQLVSEGGNEPYQLTVRFGRKAARVAAERIWHASQAARTAEDGRLELTLTVGGRGDVLRWLLGFGREVEVVAPEWMRSLLRKEARAAARANRPLPPPSGCR